MLASLLQEMADDRCRHKVKLTRRSWIVGPEDLYGGLVRKAVDRGEGGLHAGPLRERHRLAA